MTAEREKTNEKELTPYRPSEWDVATFRQKIHDERFADYAYEAHSVDQQGVKLTELWTTTVQKIPTAIKRLNIWGGADEFNHGGDRDDGSLTVRNLFRNEDMFKAVIRALRIADTVGYEECKKRLTELGSYLNTIGHYDEPDVTKKTEEGFLIEVAIQLYYQAVYVTDQHETTQTRLEQEWEDLHQPQNKVAYEQILRHMPPNIHQMESEKELMEATCPKGQKLPKDIARRFFRKNVLQLLRPPIANTKMLSILDRIHPMWFEERFVSNGLTLTEHRALRYCLRGIPQTYRDRLTFQGDESVLDSEQNLYHRKYQWLLQLENNFKDSLAKAPKKEAVDYTGDYGWWDPDAAAATTTTIADSKKSLDNLGNNDVDSKMMKDWLDKKPSATESNAAAPPARPMMPMMADLKKNALQRGNLLSGIQQKASQKN